MAEIAGCNAKIADLTGSDHEHSWTIDAVAEMLEITAFEQTCWRHFISGLSSWTGTVECFVDSASGTPTLGASFAAAAFYVNATAYITGDIIVSGISLDVGVDGVETYTITFQGTGPLDFTNWP